MDTIRGALTAEELDVRIRTILPAEYQETYSTLEPAPMRSAGLKYSADGLVAWNEIWQSFCDLAMAGGPPHKGALLQPGTRQQIAADGQRYDEVVAEVCRGVSMATGLRAMKSASPGWIRVTCDDVTTAGWLLRAIVMENVSARATGKTLELPASPAFRLEKEIKNVVTVAAKTYHYWDAHMPYPQQWAIRRLFEALARECPLVEPEHMDDPTRSDFHASVSADVARQIQQDIGLNASGRAYAGWLGLELPSVRDAVWFMRALVVCNVLSRREESVLFVPVNTRSDPAGMRMRQVLDRVHQLWLRP